MQFSRYEAATSSRGDQFPPQDRQTGQSMSICCNFPSDDTNTNQQELHTREGAQITNRAAGPGNSFEFPAVMVSNVSSRLARGSLIVLSFAEIIQHPPQFVWGPLIVRSCAAK